MDKIDGESSCGGTVIRVLPQLNSEVRTKALLSATECILQKKENVKLESASRLQQSGGDEAKRNLYPNSRRT